MKASKEMLIEALEERFDIISARLVEKINKVEDVVVLKGLLRQAMRCKSLEEFDRIMEKAM